MCCLLSLYFLFTDLLFCHKWLQTIFPKGPLPTDSLRTHICPQGVSTCCKLSFAQMKWTVWMCKDTLWDLKTPIVPHDLSVTQFVCIKHSSSPAAAHVFWMCIFFLFCIHLPWNSTLNLNNFPLCPQPLHWPDENVIVWCLPDTGVTLRNSCILYKKLN